MVARDEEPKGLLTGSPELGLGGLSHRVTDMYTVMTMMTVVVVVMFVTLCCDRGEMDDDGYRF